MMQEEEWRKIYGVVPVISSLHPSNQPFINVTNDEPATRRGIWKLNQSYKDGIMSILSVWTSWISNVKVQNLPTSIQVL